MRLILKTIYYIFIAAIACIALFLLFSAIPIPGNYRVLTVMSGSMEPAIKTGSLVIIKPSAGYQVGDIITFGKMSKTQIPTTHRILEKKGEGPPTGEAGSQATFVTKGDANNAPDAKEISQNEIIGKVLLSIPYAGFAVSAAQKPVGFVLIIIVPAAIIVYDEILKIIREIKKIREKKKSQSLRGTE